MNKTLTFILLLASSPAAAWTPAEIDSAMRMVDTQYLRECAEKLGGSVEQTAEAKDLNNDGVEEIIVSVTAPGAHACIGRTGKTVDLLISDGRGGWQQNFGFGTDTLLFHPRADSAWPDIEFTGPGFCFPIWRFHNGTYGIWKTCESGKLVFAEGLRDGAVPSGRKQASTSVAAVGNTKPIEVVDVGTLDGMPYDHNGSIVIVDGAKGIIAYQKPKKAIAGTIKPGTVLFRGSPWNMDDPENTILKGVAFVFKKGCDAAQYDVRGTYHFAYQTGQFVLEGVAPVRAQGSCEIVGHDITAKNARLQFNLAWD